MPKLDGMMSFVAATLPTPQPESKVGMGKSPVARPEGIVNRENFREM